MRHNALPTHVQPPTHIGFVQGIVGGGELHGAVDCVLGGLQSTALNRQLVLTLLDALFAQLFPELLQGQPQPQ